MSQTFDPLDLLLLGAKSRYHAADTREWLVGLGMKSDRVFTCEELELLERTQGPISHLEMVWVYNDIWCYRYTDVILGPLDDPLAPERLQIYVLGYTVPGVLYPAHVCAREILGLSSAACDGEKLSSTVAALFKKTGALAHSLCSRSKLFDT